MVLFYKLTAVGATEVGVTTVGVIAVRNDLKLWTIINIQSTNILYWFLFKYAPIYTFSTIFSSRQLNKEKLSKLDWLQFIN